MAKVKTVPTEGGFMRVKKAVGSALGSVMSYPSNRRGAAADADRQTLKEANKWDGAPNFNEDGSVTDAFKVRSAARDVYYRRVGKNIKPR